MEDSPSITECICFYEEILKDFAETSVFEIEGLTRVLNVVQTLSETSKTIFWNHFIKESYMLKSILERFIDSQDLVFMESLVKFTAAHAHSDDQMSYGIFIRIIPLILLAYHRWETTLDDTSSGLVLEISNLVDLMNDKLEKREFSVCIPRDIEGFSAYHLSEATKGSSPANWTSNSLDEALMNRRAHQRVCDLDSLWRTVLNHCSNMEDSTLLIYCLIIETLLGNGFNTSRQLPDLSLEKEIAQIRLNLRQVLAERRFLLDPSSTRIMCLIVRYALYRSVTRPYASHILEIAYDRSIYEIWPTLAIPLGFLIRNQSS